MQQPVNYSEERGLLYLGSCFKHACLASPANGPQIDMLPEQTPFTPTPVAALLSCISSYRCSLAEHVNNYFMTTLLCELECWLLRDNGWGVGWGIDLNVMDYLKKAGIISEDLIGI